MPVAPTVKLAICPAVTVWFAGCVLIARAVMPVPAKAIESEELLASLDTATLPLALPAECGAN